MRSPGLVGGAGGAGRGGFEALSYPGVFFGGKSPLQAVGGEGGWWRWGADRGDHLGALGSGEERQGWILRSRGKEAGGGDVVGGGGGEDKSLKRTALTAPGQQAAWGSGVTRARGPPSLRHRCLPSSGRRFRSTTCAPDRWLVIDRKVYNITKWSSRHLGGQRVIGHYAGEDATDAFLAFHRNLGFVPEFMKPLLIGELAPEEPGPRQEFPDHRGLPGPKEDR